MSWGATGRIEGTVGEDEAWSDSLTWSPPHESLAEGPAKQAEFALRGISAAFAEGIVDGAYNVSIHGHDNPENEGDRKSFGITFSPTQ